MKKILASIILFASLSSFCLAEEAKPTKIPRKSIWNQKMQSLYVTISDLLVDASSESRFTQKSNESRIKSNLSKLSKLTHDLSSITRANPTSQEEITPSDPDPSIPMMSYLFDQDVKRSLESFNSGHKLYSRSIVRSTTNYCIACHTRVQSSLNFEGLPVPHGFKNLSMLEKAEFYAATRQNNKALTLLKELVKDQKLVTLHPFDYEKSLRTALTLSIRVEKNADMALEFINTAMELKDQPEFILSDLSSWKKTVEDWKKESTRTPNSEEGYHAEAMMLVTAARSSQKFSSDHAGDIYFLRATEVVHEMLKRYPKGKLVSQGHLLLGIAYEALGDMNLWSIHEMYFESCIRNSPHSEVSKSCYAHFEKSIYQGYTGSSGLNLPLDEKKKLSDLKALSSKAVQLQK